MALNNSIDDVLPDLKLIYEEGKWAWKKDNPNGPWPELNETYRSLELQAAYYAQGRQPLKEVNKLRAGVGLYALSAAENRRIVTNAKPGQSNHNIYPSPALDVRFRLYAPKKPGGKLEPAGITWADKYYLQFGGYMIAAAGRLKAAGKIAKKLRWGYDWNGNGKNDQSFYDMPHYEVI